MSIQYANHDVPDLIEDLHSRKEFARLWVPPKEDDFRVSKVPGMSRKKYEPQTHQQFVSTFMNPNTRNMRMHLMHSTGCHAAGTLIRMAKPSAHTCVNKCVEEVSIGDVIATPDGCAKVIELHRGTSSMWRIIPKKYKYVDSSGVDIDAERYNGQDVARLIRDRQIYCVVGDADMARKQYVVNAAHILTMLDIAHYNGPIIDGKIDVVRALDQLSERMVVDTIGCARFGDLRLVYDDGYVCPFAIDYDHHGRFYGFTLSNNGRFYGSDGLLLHNSGKCLMNGTLVKMHQHGIIVPVEKICAGDLLLGDDGSPRIVLGTTNGVDDECFTIYSGISDPYTVNSEHILTVAREDGEIIDINVQSCARMMAFGARFYACKAAGSFHGNVVRKSRAHTTNLAQIRIVSAGQQAYSGFELDGNGRFQLADGTITHNSRAAIGVAQKCIAVYRQIYRDVDFRHSDIISPSVYIIAFSGKRAFVNDLMADPEYGYVSASEGEELAKLSASRSTNSTAEERFVAMRKMLTKRLTNRSKGGFYQFLGYDEFVNSLFRGTAGEIADVVQTRAAGEDVHMAVARAVDEGRLKINTTLLAQMKNSLMICDEIHNTYNTQTVNNRGIAIQYVLDHVEGLRFLSLSATPINNSPAEIVDFLNYFVESADRIRREDLFSGFQFKSGALEKIASLMAGHMSTIYDVDPTFFPSKQHVGGSVQIDSGNDVVALPYLRFTPCKMSEFFMSALKEFHALQSEQKVQQSEQKVQQEDDSAERKAAENRGEQTVDFDDEIVGVSQRYYSLFDMVYPNPNSETIGLYDSSSYFSTIHNAPIAWKSKEGVISHIEGDMRVLSGRFLVKENLHKYSAKYARLIEEIGTAIRTSGACKMLVFHERVRSTGVIQIQEIFRMNGFIDYNADAADNTRCAICFEPRDKHGNGAAGHEFRAIKFASVYSELEKHTFDTIISNYQSVNNLHGEWCTILLGSQVLRESFDLRAIRHLFVLSLPVSVPQLIQVFGRCIRRNSHANLPPEERNVQIHILINVPPDTKEDTERGLIRIIDPQNAPEVRKYAIKLQAYLIIQQIERELARISVDAGVNRNLITLQDNQMGLLSYEEPIKFVLPKDSSDLHVDEQSGLLIDHGLRVNTFFAYGYAKQEIRIATDIIKRLFKIQNVWRYRELRSTVRKPPFSVYSNPALISDDSITIAISFLISATGNVISSSNRAVVVNDVECRIVQSGEFLFLAPMTSIEVAGVVKFGALVDVESYMRVNAPYWNERIVSIDQYELRASFEESVMKRLRSAYIKPNDAKKHTRSAPLGAMLSLRQFLVEFSSDQQRIVAQRMIENTDFLEEFWTLYSFLSALGVFVTYGYVRKYKDVVKYLDPAYAKDLTDDDPVGIGDNALVRIYTGTTSADDDTGGWVDIGRGALNLHTEYEERDPIVGIYEQFHYDVKFKLREPIHKLRASRGHDSRLVKRGIACATKPRREVEALARQLGIPMAEIKGPSVTVAQMCDRIQVELLKLEIAERSDKYSNNKYVYGWWNNIPAPF